MIVFIHVGSGTAVKKYAIFGWAFGLIPLARLALQSKNIEFLMSAFLLIIGIALGVGLIWYLLNLSSQLRRKTPASGTNEFVPQEAMHEVNDRIGGYLYLAGGLAIGLALVAVYFYIEGTVYEGHFREWLNLAIRLMHVTFGIAWIGASFYFVFLENSLNRTDGVRDELAGNLWAVHGGGFYYLEKYKLAPKKIPKELHWFKYEAYFTWITGICLLAVVYYFNARGILIDPAVLDMSPAAAITISIASLAAGWMLYAWLSNSPLAKHVPTFVFVGFLILAGFAWGYCQLFSARAAFIHFGALLGTLMAGNVFFAIIPAQKAMVKAAREGRPFDPRLGKHAGWRSLHNNYFTLPVLFVMISNHFPSTFGHDYNWLVLAAISLGTAGIKHYFNLVEQKRRSVWVLPLSVFLLLVVAFVTAPKASSGECKTVSFSQIYTIFNERCVSCHSSRPTDEVWTSPPNGIVYDSPGQIASLTDKILQRVVITKTMPQNNKTGMTPEERELIRCWIEQGAKVE